MMVKRLLFVCLGNICRSPAAEAVMVKMAEARGIPLEVDSAGTIAEHAGNRPDRRIRAAGEARGYQFLTVARQVTRDDLKAGSFDLVIAMDRENLADLRRLAGCSSAHIRLFGEFLGEPTVRDVPDPYYGGAAGFETVLDMLEAGCPRILDALTNDGAANKK
jgi:protein-tyrosine phosphatase